MSTEATLPRLFIVVPVLNEEGNLPRLFQALRGLQALMARRFQIHCVLVDDGSSDDTVAVARVSSQGVDLSVLSHSATLGPGRAFASAFEHLSQKLESADWVLTMEGDNTSSAELVGQMLTRTEEGYEVILASPYMYGGSISNTPAFRVVLSHFANGFAKQFLGCHGLLTLSSFYRLYSGAALRKLMDCYGSQVVESPGFECMVEMTMKMVALRLRISEVPMVLDSSRRIGASKMRVARTVRGYLRLLLHRRRWWDAAQKCNAPKA